MPAATKLKDVCSLEEKLWQLRQHIKKQRHSCIPLPTKICIVKAMVFPVVMYGCESWTTKKAEHWRIEAFELWCWRRLFRVPWIARRSDQSILKEVNPKLSLEELIIKLKLQYFGYMMRTANSLEKILMLAEIEGRNRRGQQSMRCLHDISRGFPGDLDGKESICNVRDPNSISGWGRSAGKGNGNPL